MDSFIFKREIYGSQNKQLSQVSNSYKHDFEESMLNRLGLAKTLEGHDGCVNTLRWNNDGTLLASGSDDRSVIVWDASGNLRKRHHTNHDGNIFGVEFIPYGCDRIVATCAGDHMIKQHDVEKGEELHSFSADGRVKRLATAPDEPHLFFSACEDGCVRQHDVRTDDPIKIIEAPHGRMIKTMSVCQGRTELIAIGLSVYYVPIYDRRMLANEEKKIVYRCAPADYSTRHPLHTPFYSTHVAFDYSGKELIVNQNGGTTGGAVFVYNLEDPTSPIPTVQKLQRVLDGTIDEPPGDCEHELDKELVALKNKAKELMGHPVKNYAKVIRLYTECIFGDFKMSKEQRSMLYGNRSFAYALNKGQGDYYAAVRDALEALRLNPRYVKGFWRLMKALLGMRQYALLEECIEVFKKRYPPADKELAEMQKLLDRGKNEAGQKELLFADLRKVPVPMVDYEGRYTGHRNIQTDIKESMFMGTNNQYIISGSDDGSLVIWDRDSGLIKTVFNADEDILNIAQPHPDKFLIATSGIEHCIRFWEPLPEGEKDPRRRTVEEMPGENQLDYLYYLHAMMSHRHRRHEEGGDEIFEPEGHIILEFEPDYE